MKISKFTDIEQFRNIIGDIKHKAQYQGQDESDEPIYDETVKLPTLEFVGRVKLHGTNCGVGETIKQEIWYQSRERIIELGSDNKGFAAFAASKLDIFKAMFTKLRFYNAIGDSSLVIYGEWIGEGIQKNMGINNLSKRFVIFSVKVVTLDEEKPNYYLPIEKWCYLSSPKDMIFNISDYKSYSISIDFNNPKLCLAELKRMTLEVEAECPVAKAMGADSEILMGEGIVWTAWNNGSRYIFKTKGKKHKVSTPKTIIEIAPEKLESIGKFVEYACTENRLNQAIEQLFESQSQIPTIRDTGNFIKWINKDILKEESDVIVANELEWKEVSKPISVKARNWYMSYLDKLVGL